MIETIKQRIISGYYTNNEMTEEEFLYLKNNEEIQKEFMKYLSENESVDLMIPQYDNTFSNFLEELLISNEYEDKNSKVNTFFNILKLLSKEFFDISIVNDIYDSGYLTKEERDILNEKYSNFLLTTNENISIFASDANINYILDLKRYDLLFKVKPNSLSDEVKERLKKEFPFGEMEIPDILLNNDCYRIDDVSSKRLMERLSSIYPNDRSKEVFEKLIDKLINSNEQVDYSMQKNFSEIIDKFPYYSLKDISDETIVKLAKKGFINDSVFNYLLVGNVLPKEELYDIFYNYLEKSEEPFMYMNLFPGMLNDIVSELQTRSLFFKDNTKENEIDEDLYNKLIKNGYGLYYLLNKNVEDIYHSEAIIEELKKGNNKLLDIKQISFDKIHDNKVLYDYIFNNIDLVTINYDDSVFSFDPSNLHIEKNSEDYNNLKKIILKNKCGCYGFKWFDEDIFQMYVEKGDYYNIGCIYNNSDDLEKNLITEWLIRNKNNIKLLNEFIKFGTYNIDIMKIVLQNEILIPSAMSRILHNDILLEEIDNNIYDLTKNYYGKKYGLNVENMNLLVESFGPKIILHIDDPDLKSIINLDKEELIKIIKLFPMDYSLIDVEATHESIMQFEFKRDDDNQEMIDVFKHLKNAIIEKNENSIKKYKYLMMSRIDIGYFDRIKSNIESLKSMNLEDALDYLISNFNNDDLREVLHTLSKNAISTERKFYVANKYYKNSSEYKKSDLHLLIKQLQEKAITTIDDNSSEFNSEIGSISSKIIDYCSKEYISNFVKKYNFKDIEEAKEYISNNFNTNKAKYIMSEIIENAISYQKSNSEKDYSIYAQFKLEYEFDEKSKKNEIEKDIIKNCFRFFINGISLEDHIIDKLEEHGLDYTLSKDLINYYSNKDAIISSDKNEVKKNIGLLFKVATKIIRDNYDYLIEYGSYSEEKYIEQLDLDNKIKRIYKVNPSKSDIYGILSLLNIDLIRNNLFNDEEKYNVLLKIMSKTKPYLLDEGVFKYIDDNELPLTSDVQDISAYINYFSKIMEEEEENLKKAGKNGGIKDNIPSIVSVLNQSGVFASVNSIYSKILGIEDAKLIKSNPGPNSASRKTKNNQRLKEAVDNTIKCYKRSEVLIPTFDEEFETPEGKKLEVVVGNFTAPCNLTHGERTGACMRIGGAGEDLFDFCLNDIAGFHIRYEDPETHKYVSRVSGFRNGNTVYLNQLRNSLVDKYSDEDLVKITRKVAQKMIDMSKDSDNPIENVFVTNGYAASNVVEKYRLDFKKVVQGLEKIYTDYSYSDAIVLATTAAKDYAPLQPGNKGIKPYKVQKSKVRKYTKINEASSRINRIISVNQLLKGFDISELSNENNVSDIIYAIATDNWYIYVDNDLDIKTGLIDDSSENVAERDSYLAAIVKKINQGEIREVSYGF